MSTSLTRGSDGVWRDETGRVCLVGILDEAPMVAPPAALDRAVSTIVESLRSGGTLFAAGNGGSDAHAAHLVAELVGRFAYDRPPLRAVHLSSGGPVGSCIANDYGWESVYSRQVEALCGEMDRRVYEGPGFDVLVVFSTSGQSANVLAALRAANKNRAALVAFVGPRGIGVIEPDRIVDVIEVRSKGARTPDIQEDHQVWVHAVAERVERELCPR